MGKIFCLMGKSASGKDTIYNCLLEKKNIKLKPVVSYTTRPKRLGEIDGENYFFCTDEEADIMENAGKVIELRSYNTVHGIWKYFTADDGQICLEQYNYLMIGTLEVYSKIREYFGKDNVCPIYVWVDNGVRLKRALLREQSQNVPKYAEMCRRFLADEQDFSDEKLRKNNIKIQFENCNMNVVLEDIISYIEDNIK